MVFLIMSKPASEQAQQHFIMKLLYIALVIFYVAYMVHSQTITFDESKLCVSYQIGITWINAPTGAKIKFQNPITQLASFTVSAASGTKWLYFLPTQDVSYDTYMFDSSNTLLSGATYTGPAPCTNLETYGLEVQKQAVVIMNYVRNLNALTPLYWHSSLQSYSQYIADNSITSCVGADVISYGYAYYTLSCNVVSSSTFDPGSLVQSMINRGDQALSANTYNEVGFGYNATTKNWRYVLATRISTCPNGFINPTESCDTGSSATSGCNSCQVTSGYTCTNGVFTMGSKCSLTTPTPTTPVAQTPTATPSATPVVSQPPSATPTTPSPVNSPTATPVATTPSGGVTPSATPSGGVTPSTTPSGGVTPSATPSGGVTPSATPSTAPVVNTPSSSPTGGITPSSSPANQGTPSNSQSPDGSLTPSSSTPSDVNTPSDSNSPSGSSEPASNGQTPSSGPVKNAPFDKAPKSLNIFSSASKTSGILLGLIMTAVFIL